jgi:hypothetical protein
MSSKVPSAAAWAPLPEGTVDRKPLAPFREWLRKKIRERMQERFEARREGDEQAPDRSGDANRTLSALDYYGIWKVFDGLIDAAFYGKSRNYALDHRHELGLWSDGVPVKDQ